MHNDSSQLRDEMSAVTGYGRPTEDASTMYGYGVAEVHGPDGELKASVPFTNLITQVGEQRYGEAGAGVGSLAAPATMQLGTGTTAATKTGSTAAIVTVVASSVVAIGTPTSALSGSNTRQLTYSCTWPAGTATASGISEVVLTNQGIGTQTAAPASATYSRALLSPTVNKGASDSLTVTWNHAIGT